jgi:ABC-2 type transport system permease protein/oleandomycin transport system permease protein
MARSAVLAGRSLSDLLRICFTVLVMLVVGVAVGMRFHTGPVHAIAALLLVAYFGFAFTWISAWIGLTVRTVEAANLAGFVWLFPLTFASSAFAPVQTMPGWLQAFAKATPVTPTVDAVRALINGGNVARPLVTSLCWCTAIAVVFSWLAIRRYRRIS